MNLKFLNHIIPVLFVFCSITSAQDIALLEKNYSYLRSNLEKEQTVLDSLKIILNRKADQINSEKNRKDRDNNKIVELMAASVTVSNKYQLQQQKVNDLIEKFEAVKKKLNEKYQLKIDSLRSEGDESEVNSELIYYIEKKIAVSPEIAVLSFNPSRLLEIKPDGISDSLQKVIYKDYVKNALNEVNNLLAGVNENYSEVSDIIRLQKKMERFLKETEFEGGLSRNVTREEGTKPNEPGLPARGGGGDGEIGMADAAGFSPMMQQYASYSLLLSQLDPVLHAKKLRWQGKNLKGSSDLSLKEYKELLSELKESLEQYKLVLNNKLGSFK